MSLRSAARLFVRSRISGAPVVDAEGSCVGVLTASDFVRWTQDEVPSAEDLPLPACPYQQKGRLLTGEDAVICILAEGNCPWQKTRPGTGGRHTTLCQLPSGIYSDWQQVTKNLPRSAVRRYMTADVVTVGPDTPLPELARVMVHAGIHRVLVVDELRRPTGIVTSMDILAAVARAEAPAESKRPGPANSSRRRTACVSGASN
jgi:CBS domain-containing protein